MLFLLFFAAIFLAYSNGANDNFKGVATLFGSNSTSYKTAISWATLTTFLGAIASIFLAGILVKNFSGKGLVPDEIIQDPHFAISIALGAAITVFLATKLGLPISTTHGLVGSLFGSGMLAVGMDFNFSKLSSVFLFPLIFSPFIACAISLITYNFFKAIRLRYDIRKSSQIYIEKEEGGKLGMANFQGALMVQKDSSVSLKISQGNNEMISANNVFEINSGNLLRKFHFLSSGIVSFARGLNDTPKIVGLLIVINTLDLKWSMFTIAIAMAVGGLLSARNVGITVSKKITAMNEGQGFTANLITGLLVTTASIHGMPVSTTHVSVGSIFGISLGGNKSNSGMIGKILLSWLFTLPVGALCGAAVYLIISNLLQ